MTVALFDAGLTDLVSVIPPGARLAEGSTINPALLGKIPGRLMSDGSWAGYHYLRTPSPDRETVASWEARGANMGLLGARFPAVDIDVERAETAAAMQSLALAMLGPAPVRSRPDSARVLLMYRTETPFPKRRFVCAEGAVDVLADGQQYLVHGTHPSGARYRWSAAPNAATLTLVTAEQVDAFLGALGQLYDGVTHASGERTGVDQSSLVAPSTEALAEVVRAIPNTERSRDRFIQMGAAIKAAGGDVAFPRWWDWSERLPGVSKSDTTARAEWDRLNPPFAIGYPWLLDQARAAGYAPPVVEFEPAAPITPPPPTSVAPCSDLWLAQQLVEKHGSHLRYNRGLGGWFVWNGSTWAPDTLEVPMQYFRDVADAAAKQVRLGKNGEAEAKRLCSTHTAEAVLRYARSFPGIATAADAFDADPWMLNTPSGIVDLRTGVPRASDPAAMLSKCTEVAPSDAPPTRWLAFLQESCGGDQDLVDYLQRLVGYCLTGCTDEHVLAFLWGQGANGKSTFLNTIVRMLGTYAKVAAMDLFTSSRFERHSADLAVLRGARVVISQETQEDRAWDEAKIKSITAGDPLTARLMRENPTTFLPQFTLLFAGNHQPHLHTVDAAVVRRFHMVPFTRRPAVLDRTLSDQLAREMPGILGWAIAGAQAWRATGLQPPAAVRAATRDYLAEENPFERWMQECCVPDASGTLFAELFVSWRQWCGENAEAVGTEKRLGMRLRAAAITHFRDTKSAAHMYALSVVRPGATFDRADPSTFLLS